MLNWLRRRQNATAKATELYGAVVTGARQPYFFQASGVPDTPEGRLEMLILHLFLVLERLRQDGPAAEELSRSLIETFVSDLDASLREMGVSDLSVPKKVQGAAAIFYARSDVYRSAIATQATAALEKVLASTVCTAPAGGADSAQRLASYVLRSTDHLAGIDVPGGAASGLFPLPGV